MSNTDFKKQGKLNRKRGADFERRVRNDLVDDGFVVNRWSKGVDFEDDKLVDSRPLFINGRVLNISSGFPDFMIYQPAVFEVEGVECKINGKLDAEEKRMAKWLLDKKIFAKLWIASKVKEGNRIKIKYEEFSDKEPKYDPRN